MLVMLVVKPGAQRQECRIFEEEGFPMKNRKDRLVQLLVLLTAVLKLLKAAWELLNLAFNYLRKDAGSNADTSVLEVPIQT
jgi:hypothetical protein